MERLHNLLDTISHITWFIDALSLGGFYLASKKIPDKCSSLYTMMIIFVVGTTMLGYRIYLIWLIGDDTRVNPTINFFWYLGFSTFDLLLLVLLVSVHKIENIKLGSLARYAGAAFICLGLIQLLQYTEIIVFHTDHYIDPLYSLGIPSINIATTLVCFSYALLALYHTHISHQGIKGIKRWTI